MSARVLLGATSAAPILGISPWTSAHDLWRSLRGEPEALPSPAMLRGLACEPHLARRISALLGVDLLPVSPVYGPGGYACLRISGDYRSERTGFEMKTSGFYAHETWESLPDYYVVQCVLEAWAHGLEEVIVPALVVPRAFGELEALIGALDRTAQRAAIEALAPVMVAAADVQIYRVGADDQYAEAIARTMAAWWERHVEGGEEPEVRATDAWAHYARTQLVEREPLREATGAEIALVEAYDEARRVASEAKAHQDELGARLKAAIGTAAGFKTGSGYAAARPQGPRTDWRAVAGDLAMLVSLRGGSPREIIDRHTRPAEGRTLSVKIERIV